MRSYIGYTPSHSISYAIQYQEAFEFLFNNIDNTKKESKLIDLPLFYLLRHYLELSFKYNIAYFKDFSDSNELVEKLTKTHELNKLYTAFKNHFNKSFNKLSIKKDMKRKIKEYFKYLDKLIIIMSKLDDTGVSFRYSHNQESVKNLDYGIVINLIEDIGKPYKKSKDILDYSIDVHKDIIGIS